MCSVLAVLLVTGTVFPAIVVCHGDDGHVALESHHMGACDEGTVQQCSSVEANSQHQLLSNKANHDDSAQCRDIPLDSHAVVRGKTIQKRLVLRSAAPVYSAAASFISFGTFCESHQSGSPPPEIKPHSLTGTVILIA